MNLFTITGEIVLQGGENVKKQMNTVTNSVANNAKQMEQYFTRLGGILLTAFSVKSLVNFTKQLAETSAKVHEEVAQYNAVLGDMASAMDEAVNRVSESTGILQTRLKNVSSSIYAMFAGAEMESTTALDYTERFLRVASDASAFYDKSMEEVQSDMQSFMRGVTRAGYSLGLYTSELQRNEKALATYGKKYEELGQAERYTVMLDIIEQTYELSGVTGQATRESEQWLNVTSNLTEAWKQFSASLGDTAMNALLKPIKGITDQLLKWKEKLDELNEWRDEHLDEILTALDSVKDKFILLAVAVLGTISALASLGAIKNIITGLAKNWLLVLAIALALVTLNVIKLWNTSEEFRDAFKTVWQTIKNDVSPLIESFSDVWNSLGSLFSTVWTLYIKPALVGIMGYLKLNKDNIITLLSNTITHISTLINLVTDLLLGDWTGVSNHLLTALTEVQELAEEGLSLALDALGIDLDDVLAKIDKLANESWLSPVLKPVVEWTSESWTTFKNACITGDWSAILGEGLKWATIGITFAEVGSTLKSVLATIITAIAGLQSATGLNLSSGQVVFALLSIGVQFVEAWKEQDYSDFVTNLISGLSLAIGIGILTHNPSLGVLALTIAVNFKFGEWLDDFKGEIQEKLVEYGASIDENDNVVVKGTKATSLLWGLFSSFFSPNSDNLTTSAIHRDYTSYSTNLSKSERDKLLLQKGYSQNAIDEFHKKYPKLAEGGIVDEGTLAMVGEAGREAIVPLENNIEWVDGLAEAITTAFTDTFDFSSLFDAFDMSGFTTELVNQLKNTAIYQAIAKALGINTTSTETQPTAVVTEPETKEDISYTDLLNPNGTSAWDIVWDKIKSGAKATADWISNAYVTCFNALFGTGSDIEKNVQDFFSSMLEQVEAITGYIESYVTPLFDAIIELQEQRMQQTIDTLEDELETLKTANEAELENKQTSYDEQLKSYYKMLDLGEISYDEYADKVKKADADITTFKDKQSELQSKKEDELLKKKDELARKQFEGEKATSIANVWINTATAIMKAFAELGVVGGGIASALLLATAGVQTATIAEQEYTPLLAKGGVVSTATNAIIGEDGAEAVVPLERNLGWVNGLATALEPVVTNNAYDYTPQISTISEQLDELKSLLGTFLPLLSQQEIVLDGAIVGRRIAPYMDNSLGLRQRYANRGL